MQIYNFSFFLKKILFNKNLNKKIFIYSILELNAIEISNKFYNIFGLGIFLA